MKPTRFVCLALAGAAIAFAEPAAGGQQPAGADWRSFEAVWSASGARQVLPAGDARPAATVQLSGAVVLTGDQGLGRGFRGEAVGFDDGTDLVVLRAVWTDDRGDRIFSRLTGAPMATGRRFVGTITGGTGRYAGISGEYSFSWQYVVQADDGTVQGRTVGLTGRVRGGGPVR